MRDPNPNVAGAGLQRLGDAGIDTAVGLLEILARELNRGFVSRMLRGRPWVTVKLGTSADGRTALADGASRWITSPAARADVQRLRARASAIVTGIGTVLVDDPLLTVRDPALELFGRDPLRVVFDTSGRLHAGAKLVQDGKPTLVFAAAPGLHALRASLGMPHASLRLEPLAANGAGRLDLGAALQRLAELECNDVLVEAGPRLAGGFLAAGLVDEIVLYVAPTLLGDTARPSFVLPAPLRTLAGRPVFSFFDVRQTGPDLRLTLRPAEA
jgi:diaminohydroxyphosphoribosylaminopyrimidine deaminase/5-amino-6-(5-phosphoribosylamino)uracil reductase